jgi:hypothetical protein
MLSVVEKHLVLELREMKVIDVKLVIKEGSISFDSDEDDCNPNDYSRITFNFLPSKVNTPVGIRYINSVLVNLNDNKIRFMDKQTGYGWVVLGEMKEFKEPEEAINILENFIDSITIK